MAFRERSARAPRGGMRQHRNEQREARKCRPPCASGFVIPLSGAVRVSPPQTRDARSRAGDAHGSAFSRKQPDAKCPQTCRPDDLAADSRRKSGPEIGRCRKERLDDDAHTSPDQVPAQGSGLCRAQSLAIGRFPLP